MGLVASLCQDYWLVIEAEELNLELLAITLIDALALLIRLDSYVPHILSLVQVLRKVRISSPEDGQLVISLTHFARNVGFRKAGGLRQGFTGGSSPKKQASSKMVNFDVFQPEVSFL